MIETRHNMHRSHWARTLAICIAIAMVPPVAAEDATTLEPSHQTAPMLPPLTVTAARSPGDVATAAFSTQLFDRQDIHAASATTMDDFLRQVPNFSLFRRTSSRVANPTTQGASLRGIGPSGTSRALVLYDGIPFNDAFGGWVYWSQIDLRRVEAIEVVRGGGSAAWGNTALGGVVHIIPRSPTPRSLETEAYLGNHNTRSASFTASDRDGPIGVAVEARYFSTDGFTRVRPSQRGAVDIPTDAQHRLVNLVVDYEFGESALLTVRGSYFDEDRGNGTPLSNNETTAMRIHSKLEWTDHAQGDWRLDAYAGKTDYAATFTSVSADRNSEQLVLDQHSVPSKTAGGALHRSFDFLDEGRLTLGADLRWVEGETNEYVVFQGDDRRAGGAQLLSGLFLEHDWEPHEKWRWQLGLRGDYWRSYDGFIIPPNGERTDYADRDRFIFNARLGTTYQLDAPAQVRGAVYQAFRVPTINELYRPFQVGADVTQANATLDPERLIGGELGLDFFPTDRLSLRNTAFANQVDDPILNVTIGTTPQGGQLRQRRNIKRTEIFGLESELEYKIGAGWRTFISYAYTDARVARSREQPELEGNRLAQVPRHNVTGGVAYESMEKGPGFLLQGRWNGDQFEDDQNQRRLAGYFTVDLSASYRIAPGRELFIGIENLFDRRAPDGITGNNLVTQIAPRTYHAGLRFAF